MKLIVSKLLFSENMISMLENIDPGTQFSDLQFWETASNPVLSSDAFSTLLWILFCLPVPFMPSEKIFFPLVHMCYVISVTQVDIKSIFPLLYISCVYLC